MASPEQSAPNGQPSKRLGYIPVAYYPEKAENGLDMS
jgi:hypothetical protein